MKIALIAGEASGDQLGGWLIEALKQKNRGGEYIGLGGARMKLHGLRSLFPMEEISLIGFTEVLPHYFAINKRINRMVEFIEAEKPEMLITIDSAGFNFRVVNRLRQRGIHRPQFIHYVAPTVWAYKPKRAKLIASLYDKLLCLLPFEPPYFEKEGLKTHFVGHEVAWFWRERGDGKAFRERHVITADAPILALFPGSRHGELNRMLPTFRKTIEQLQHRLPNLQVVIQVPEFIAPRMRKEVADWPVKTLLLTSAEERRDLFAAATAGLAKSGTIGLECVLAGLASVITYKANPITIAILKRIIRVPYVNLANILAGRMIIPELLQEKATPERITTALLPLLANERAREAQREELKTIAAMLGAEDSKSPSEKAADILIP